MTGYQKASEIASRVLRESGITGPAVSVLDLCRNYGLQVEVRPLSVKTAFLIRSDQKIVVAPMKKDAMRWHVAHELGHWILP